MLGPEILVRSLSAQRIADQYGNAWQYHPQSDRHSKIACWVVLFDLFQRCALLRQHAAEGKIGFGINHRMVDFTSGRHKDLDLVISIPREDEREHDRLTFAELAKQFEVALSDREAEALANLPTIQRRPVGDVLLALEAKASMTAQVRAGPRLYDELTSAWQCINGAAPHALAVALGMVNASSEFISPKMNRHPLSPESVVVGRERQPNGVNHVQNRFRSLKVRGHVTERGYDAIGVLTVFARNDGSPITIAPSPPALPPDDGLHYERMILRMSGLYDSRFLTR